MQKFEPGPLTEEDIESVRMFQEKYGLQVDGDIGHEVWNYVVRWLASLCKQVERLKAENEGLMLGIEDTRGSSCLGCGFVGIVVGGFAVWALIAFI